MTNKSVEEPANSPPNLCLPSRVRPIDRRRAVCRRTGDLLRREAERWLATPGKLHAALLGDDEAAAELWWEHEGDSVFGLGPAALAAYWLGTPFQAFRQLLEAGWSDNWRSMTDPADVEHRFVRRVFRAARFEHHLEGRIQIFRGTAGGDLKTAANGLSWSTNRDVACWFAHRYRGEGQPNVLKAIVDASKIIYYQDGRFEQEVILQHPPAAAIDSDPSSWVEAMERYDASLDYRRLDSAAARSAT